MSVFSLRIQIAAFVVTVLVCGCGPSNLALVDDVPLPPFGPRTDARVSAPASWTHGSAAAVRRPAASSPSGQWVPSAPERQWRFIIVHHSATASGDAASFDRAHRNRGWDELGYHFVIGNGSASGDGQVEVGSRWWKQKHGAHCKVRGHDEYNELGIGICLVGNFNQGRPSPAQMRALVSMTRRLMERYGIPKSRVLGHSHLAPTDCPGTAFDFQAFYRML